MTSNTHSRERQPGSVSNCYCSRVQPRLPLLIPGACSACMRGGQGHLQEWAARGFAGGNGLLRQVGKCTCRGEWAPQKWIPRRGCMNSLEHWLFLRDIQEHVVLLSLNLLDVQKLALDQEGFLTAHWRKHNTLNPKVQPPNSGYFPIF